MSDKTSKSETPISDVTPLSKTASTTPQSKELSSHISLPSDAASSKHEAKPVEEAKPAETPKDPLSTEARKEPTTKDELWSQPADKAANKKVDTATNAAPEAKAKPATPSVTPPPPATPPKAVLEQPKRRGGFFAPLLGGVVAAGLGFGLAHVVPQGWPLSLQADHLAALQTRIAEQDARLADIANQAKPATDETLAPRLAALEAHISGPNAELENLRDEITRLKEAMAGVSAGDGTFDAAPLRAEMAQEIAALRAQIAALPATSAADFEALKEATKAEREAVEARAEAIRAEAEANAKAAIQRGAILRVQAALESGNTFEAALADVAAAGLTVPAALADHAKGIPALSDLQNRFPAVARTALAASAKPEAGAGLSQRFTAFLTTQTGLRSLTPQQGSSPDAVLSRAEAAVQAGDLKTALTELDALPPEGAAAVADWRAEAEARLAATAAAQSLIADLDKP